MAKQNEVKAPEATKAPEQPKPPEQPRSADLKQDLELDGRCVVFPSWAGRLLPGDSVCILDRWVDAGSLAVCAGIVTGTNECDEGHYNVRILQDPGRGDSDRNCLSVRPIVHNEAPRQDERYVIITKEEAAHRLFKKPAPPKKRQ